MLAEKLPAKLYKGKAAGMGVAAATIEAFRVPSRETIQQIDRFCHLALVKVDEGDCRNYPKHSRSFGETGQYYYGDIFNGCDDCLSLERRMRQWLSSNKLYNPEVADWFKTNWVWEHVAGGGSVEDIPKEWKKYLRTKLNGVEYGYPGEMSIRKWGQYEDWEQVVAYRMVTNLAFTKAMFSYWQDGLTDEQMSKMMELVQIYQLTTDSKHRKNSDELIMSRIVQGIGGNCRHTFKDEVNYICDATGFNKFKGQFAYTMAKLVCRGKVAEWENES